MDNFAVQVRAPCRLHFGLLRFGDPKQRQYGGVGVMIRRPNVTLRIEKSDEFSVSGPLGERVTAFARSWTAYRQLEALPRCRVAIEEAPRQHTGLGVGTQLGLAVAAGLDTFLGNPPAPLWQLAQSVRRGLRSAVGTYGFAHGGLVAECGRFPDDAISPIDKRVELPDSWRFVLVCPRNLQGLSGKAEQEAFASLPAVSHSVFQRLWEELHDRLLPAAGARQFDDFSESVYEFGRQAGLCFATVQGGPYNGTRLASLVETIRNLGVRGVGQSSWGPTIFALCRHQDHAKELIDRLDGAGQLDDTDVWITSTCNEGARIRKVVVEPDEGK